MDQNFFITDSLKNKLKHVPKGKLWSKNTILIVLDRRFLRKTRVLNFFMFEKSVFLRKTFSSRCFDFSSLRKSCYSHFFTYEYAIFMAKKINRRTNEHMPLCSSTSRILWVSKNGLSIKINL